MHANRKRQHAFTLVELLAVVTIIVLLIALLVPSLERAKGLANRVLCGSNTRQWSYAGTQYAIDHRGRVARITQVRGDYWHHRFAAYMGFPDYPNVWPYPRMPVLECPETAMPRYATPDPGTIYQIGGSARKGWDYDTAEGSYGMNLWLSDFPDYKPGGQWHNANDYAGENWFGRWSQASGNTPVLGDCYWVGSWPRETDPDPGEYESGQNSLTARFCLNRHDWMVNLAFVDGSARALRLGELWSVPWHRNYNEMHVKDIGP